MLEVSTNIIHHFASRHKKWCCDWQQLIWFISGRRIIVYATSDIMNRSLVDYFESVSSSLYNVIIQAIKQLIETEMRLSTMSSSWAPNNLKFFDSSIEGNIGSPRADENLTFHADFVLSSARVRDEIHLHRHLPHWSIGWLTWTHTKTAPGEFK